MVFSGDYFYWKLTTKYSAAFGSLFSNIKVKRNSTDGNIEQYISVPLVYGTKEKTQARLESVTEADKQAALQLPVISYELTGYKYAADRKLISINYKSKKLDNDKNRFNLQYNPVPYDLHYKVYIYTKTMEDGNTILEQILPFFTPDFTITMDLIPEMDDKRDIPIVLLNNSVQDLGQENKIWERRILIWSLEFVVHGYLFGPVKIKPYIKVINVNFRLDDSIINGETREWPSVSNTSPIVGVVQMYPGLLANGSPTTDPTQTIPWAEIAIDDDWGLINVQTNIVAGANT